MAYVLGVDIGTGSAKAVLLDEGGALVGRGGAEYGLYTPHPGWVEQDAEDWWRGLCVAAHQALLGIDAAEVVCISLSGQLNGAVFVDEQIQPLRPVPIC